MSCTVAAGTTVFFLYQGSQLNHQIISTGSSGATTFPSSPVWDPSNSTSTNVEFTYTFVTAGTYPFIDAIDQSMRGSIIVQ
jgi:plastocyanin